LLFEELSPRTSSRVAERETDKGDWRNERNRADSAKTTPEPPYRARAFARLARKYSTTTGITEITMIAAMTQAKFR